MLWLFNAILLVLVTVAALGSLAAFRSPKVEGPEVINVMRAVRAGGWGLLALAMVGMALTHQQPPVEGFVLVVLTLLAYADAVAYTDRMCELVKSEIRTP